jgi:hypothetical protein
MPSGVSSGPLRRGRDRRRSDNGVALWCLFFLIIHFGCCSSMQVRNGVSVWGFLIGERIEWISEIFTVTVYK